MQETEENETIEYVENLKDKVLNYAELRLQLLKLAAGEKAAKLVGVLVSTAILVLTGFFFFVFISIVGGFYFSSFLGSYAAGFSVIAGFYFLIFVLVALFRKALIENVLANLVIKILYNDEEV